MKKYLYILVGLVYFSALYILKGGFLNQELTKIISNYINLEKIFYISFIFLVIFILTNGIEIIFNNFSKKQNKKSISKHILPLLKKIVKIIIWIFGIITIISNLGYNVGALLAGAGIGGIALALASQKTVANIFGAINIIINRPFEIGDSIKIGNFEGVVEDIGIIYLKVRNKDGHQIMIPNEIITSSAVENFSNVK
ncbi:MAG: mechanosensitive ion channel [Candidatus Gracilibacteria bacterium]|nr:mechanosensitive ion channel [Candidatus Gracilibacteria bacterium]